ncbi:MAG TPA: hypothetical protein VGD94_19220 [Vicinamibacterales bacterium]
MGDTTMTVQEARTNLETANNELAIARKAFAAATAAAATANGTDLIDAITARERSQRVLEIAEQGMLKAAKAFQSVSDETEKAKKARLKALAPKLLGRAGEVAKAMDSHFAALEALFDEAESLAQEIDKDFADASSTGAGFYSPEMKGLPIGGVLRVARLKKLRLVFGNWREMARPLL